jgi:hypothetical protein
MEVVRAGGTSNESSLGMTKLIVSEYVLRPQSRIGPCQILGKHKPTYVGTNPVSFLERRCWLVKGTFPSTRPGPSSEIML